MKENGKQGEREWSLVAANLRESLIESVDAHLRKFLSIRILPVC